MAYPTILLVLATILPVFGLALSTIFKRRTPFKGTRYPPGPPGKPLIGTFSRFQASIHGSSLRNGRITMDLLCGLPSWGGNIT